MADVRLGDAVTTGRPPRRILVVLVIELLVLVGSLVAAIVLAKSNPSSSVVPGVGSSATSSTAQDQAAAVAAAERFVVNVQDYPPFNQTGYQTNVVPLLTTKAKAAAASQLQAYQAALSSVRSACAKATGQAAKVCKAYEAKPDVSIAFAALASYDGSSATVLVPHLVTYVNGGASQKYEFQVTLDKVGGKWLIDTYCTANAVSTGSTGTNSAGCAS